MHSRSDERRLHPRMFDTDWLILRGLTRELARLISDNVRPAQRVLDFGCGDMCYRSLIETRKATYLGADFGSGADVSINDSGRLSVADQSVDVVISCQVLEHVRDLGTYFAEIARVLKPNGILLLSTHGTWLYHPHPEDHRRWTRMGLINEIETRGFSVQEVDAIIGPLATTTLMRLAGYVFFIRRMRIAGKFLAQPISIVMNLRAWLEDRVTPEHIRRDNACVYITKCEKVAA